MCVVAYLILLGFQDSTVENKNIPALLDGKTVVQPKEKVSSHNANRCKPDSSKLIEYWVPVQISNVQLEQYCYTLLSNASFLCSSPKIDSVGAIRDVLISIRKVSLQFLNYLLRLRKIKDHIYLLQILADSFRHIWLVQYIG